MNLASAIETVARLHAPPWRTGIFRRPAIEAALRQGMSGAQVLAAVVGPRTDKGKWLAKFSDEQIIREARRLADAPQSEPSAVDRAIGELGLAGEDRGATPGEVQRRRKAVEQKFGKKYLQSRAFVSALTAVRERHAPLRRLTFEQTAEVVVRTGLWSADPAVRRAMAEIEGENDARRRMSQAKEDFIKRGGGGHQEVADGEAARKFLASVMEIEAAAMRARGLALAHATREKDKLTRAFKAACADLVASAGRGEATAKKIGYWRHVYESRMRKLDAEHGAEVEAAAAQARKRFRELQDLPAYQDWRTAARHRRPFTGEHSGLVRRAYQTIERYGGYTYAGEAPQDPRRTTFPGGDNRTAWLDEAQRNAGWAEGELSGTARGRGEMARLLAPVITAVKAHIGRLTDQADVHARHVNGAALAYQKAVREGGEQKRYLKEIRWRMAAVSRLEARIQEAHEEWAHLEEIVESGATPDRDVRDVLTGPGGGSRLANPAAPRKFDAGREGAGGRDGETGWALLHWAAENQPDEGLRGRAISAALRVVELAEQSYRRQVKGLDPVNRPGTTSATDQVILAGKYKGLRFSEVPVSHLLWLATGARIRREEKVEYIKVGKVRVKLPFKIPRTFYKDVERVPDSHDELTRRGEYSNLPRLARKYLRTSEGARRVEAWRQEYVNTPWEEQAFTLTGQAPELDSRYSKYQEILRLDKMKDRALRDGIGREVRKALVDAAVREKGELAAKRRESLGVYDERLRSLRTAAMKELGVARMDRLPRHVLVSTERRAKAAYEADLARRGLSEYAVLYRHALHTLGLSPESADWHAKNTLKDSAAMGRFRTTLGFQDSNPTRRVREEMERDARDYFRESQRGLLEFVRWAARRREQLAKRAEGDAGPNYNRERYARELEQVGRSARAAYENFIRAETRGFTRLMPLTLRARDGGPKRFEELTWEDVYRIGRRFDAEGGLVAPGRAGGPHADFLIPADTLAFDPKLAAAERTPAHQYTKAERDRRLMSPQEAARADPLWRARGDDWYALTAPMAYQKFSQVSDLISRATTPAQLDRGLRALMYTFYRGAGEEWVLRLYEQRADGRFAVDAREVARSLDWENAPAALRSALSDYVERRHAVLSGTLSMGDAEAFDADLPFGAQAPESWDREWDRLAGDDYLPGPPTDAYPGEAPGYEREQQHLDNAEHPADDDYLHEAVLEVARTSRQAEQWDSYPEGPNENDDFRGAVDAGGESEGEASRAARRLQAGDWSLRRGGEAWASYGPGEHEDSLMGKVDIEEARANEDPVRVSPLERDTASYVGDIVGRLLR